MTAPLLAVVVAGGPTARAKVCGLTLAERGRRVALRAGAERVYILGDGPSAHGLAAWAGVEPGSRAAFDLVVVNANKQVVHSPLLEAVLPPGTGTGGAAAAIDPEDGAYAGALFVPSTHAEEALAALASDPAHGDAELAASWLACGRASARPHGRIARHLASTPAERAAATRMLLTLVHKKQDGPVTRWLYRPVALPLTRLLLPTPVTPNQVSIAVGVIGLAGCLITAGPGYLDAVVGSALVLIAGYLDCCDGEIARLRHEGSRLGAWLDTVVDETTTLAYLVALGRHVYLAHPQPWIGWSIAVGASAMAVSVYVIYYYLAVVAHSGNSQDYPTAAVGPLAPLTQLMRRDFINWAALLLAALDLTEVTYAGLVAGAVVSASVLLPQHLALRRRLRAEVPPARQGLG